MTDIDDVTARLAELLTQVQGLDEKVTGVASDAAELGGDQAELADQVRSIGETVNDLVAEVQSGAAGPGPDQRPVDWRHLSQQAARDEWERLLDWVDDVLCTRWLVTRGQLPDCWPRHAAMRDELSWLRVAWEQSLLPLAAGSQSAEWHLRYRQAALDTIRARAKQQGCRPEQGMCGGEATGWDQPHTEDALTSRACWDHEAITADIAARPEKPPAQTVEQEK